MFAKYYVLGLVLAILVVNSEQKVKYKYFDEYLLHLEKKQQTILVEEVKVKVASPLLIRTGVVRSKDEQCCMLGQVAGEKGYHCYSRFYAARILYRNYNRPHNKRSLHYCKASQIQQLTNSCAALDSAWPTEETSSTSAADMQQCTVFESTINASVNTLQPFLTVFYSINGF